VTTRNLFAEKFSQLLAEIPDGYTLPQWQFSYRQVIFSMGMKILERFPEEAVGEGGRAGSGSQPEVRSLAIGGSGPVVSPDSGSAGAGGHPNYIKFLDFPKFVLGIQCVAESEEPVGSPK
jgi:hypothetical protein